MTRFEAGHTVQSLAIENYIMKYYGFKTPHFGKAYRTENIDRRRAYYESLHKAGRSRARQEGQKQAKEIE